MCGDVVLQVLPSYCMQRSSTFLVAYEATLTQCLAMERQNLVPQGSTMSQFFISCMSTFHHPNYDIFLYCKQGRTDEKVV